MRYLLPFYRPIEPADVEPEVYFHLRGLPRGRLARVLYGTLAWDYELVVLERVVEIPFVLQHLAALAGARVLEFGCTGSPLAFSLASLGYRVTGIDLRAYGFQHRNLTFRQGDFLSLALGDGEFAAAVAVSAVEHVGLGFYHEELNGDADVQVVRKLHRILRPGGRLLITVPYGRGGRTSWYRVYDRQSLSHLLAPFKIVRTEYYAGPDRKEWYPVDEATVAGLDSVECGFTRGVACVVAEREG